MQVKSVRHNGCADDTDRNQERLAVEKLRQHAVPSGLSPIDWRCNRAVPGEAGKGRETLEGPDRGENMAHIPAADDFQAIRARMEELRRDREGVAVTETGRGIHPV
jgi:hypothetical protein